MSAMLRALWSLFKVLVIVGLVAAVAGGVFLWRSKDPKYAVYETVLHSRFHRYDPLIQDTAKRRGLDPMVVKAVVWRESKFDPAKVGLDGERGLMQITDAAAKEWVKGEKIVNFVPEDLFDPKINLEAGTWLLARGFRRYEDKDDPLPFALAEYNAGPSRASKWSGARESSGPNAQANSQQFVANINIASTKHYVETVQDRVRFYHQRGEL